MQTLKDQTKDYFEIVSCKKTKTSLTVATGYINIIAGSLEAAYSLNWGAREIWGKGGGETLALL